MGIFAVKKKGLFFVVGLGALVGRAREVPDPPVVEADAIGGGTGQS